MRRRQDEVGRDEGAAAEEAVRVLQIPDADLKTVASAELFVPFLRGSVRPFLAFSASG
jgi:hypothetical protein